MFSYKIIIHDSAYTSWTVTGGNDSRDIENPDFHPAKHKLFTNDVFLYDESANNISITHSNIRSAAPIAGVLLLSQNKTFGRTKNKKRLLYKCIPDDSKLPAFLVPYDPVVGFSKIQSNKYVLFKFDNWDEQHPQGVLIDVLGDVDKLEAFYEYQLHCKSLNISLTHFTSLARDRLRSASIDEHIRQILENPKFSVEDRRSHTGIFSIDPECSMDFDDAFWIQSNGAAGYTVSIYIANVYLWLETLNLWKSFSNRVATIYLPDRKRPMLPTVLSDSLCSLQEGVTRFAFALDICIDHKGTILSTSYKTVAITVERNYRYEECALLYENPQYKLLFDMTKVLDRNVKDSHDVVSYWMVKMNSICGEHMLSRKIGIFRKTQHTKDDNMVDNMDDNMDYNIGEESQRVIRMWNKNISGQYAVYGPDIILAHDVMKIKNYVHITTPIRRLVDLLNQMWLSDNLGPDAREFMENWIDRIDYLNVAMRSIRKIQTDCELLHRCHVQPDIMAATHKGVLFDKLRKPDGSFVYMVHLEGVGLLSRMKTYTDFDNYTTHNFRIYLFEGENNFKKKIRVQHI